MVVESEHVPTSRDSAKLEGYTPATPLLSATKNHGLWRLCWRVLTQLTSLYSTPTNSGSDSLLLVSTKQFVIWNINFLI